MNQNKIPFSVLMSVYCKENPKHFSMALNSNLVEQTLLPNEMVLVCDGELTEELNQIISEYEHKAPSILKVYRLAKNGGLGKALNFGLEKCSFEWVARSDSDDICAPDRFETQIAYISANNVDIVSSYIKEFEITPEQSSRIKKLPLTHGEIAKMAKMRNPINHMAVMFRKSTVMAAGSYQHLPYAEDYYLWIRAIAGGAKLANIPKCLVNARVGNGMVQRRGNRASISSFKVLGKFMLSHKMINRLEYARNMAAIRIFVYMPVKARTFLYEKALRKKQ